MSLQVWLPLNGDLKNKGVANTNIGSITTAQGSFISDGKIGQGLKTGTSNSISTGYTPDCIKDLTLCGWFKFNKAEIAAVLESKTYASTASKATGNLIGNSHYGGIGLCWEGNAMNTTKVFTTLKIFASIRGNSSLYYTGSINVDFDKWYHLMLIWDSTNKILNFYVNGAIYKTGNVTNAGTIRDYPININYDGVYGGGGPSANIPFVINDVRIYDHCLSQVEIKEISRGLILHYPLDNPYNASNLIENGFGQDGTAHWTGIGQSSTTEIPLNTTVQRSFAGYYSDFIRINHSHSYTISCYLKTMDPTYATVYPSIVPYDIDKKFIYYYNCPQGFHNTNKTTLAQPLKKGDTIIYATDLTTWDTDDNYWNYVAIFGYKDSTGYLYPDMEYTQDSPAFAVKGSTKTNINKTNNTITLNVAYTGEDRPAGTTICQAKDGSTYFYPFGGVERTTITTWTFKTATFNSNVSRLKYSVYWKWFCYDSSVWYAGIKLTDNNWASNIVYDCSGNGYNGTITGNLDINSDSSRYTNCLYFDNGLNNYITAPIFLNKDAITMNIWVRSKNGTVGIGNYHMPFNIGGAPYEMSIDSNGKFRQGFWINGQRVVNTTPGPDIISDKQWHMITATYDGANIKRYVDGELVQTQATSGTLTGGALTVYIGGTFGTSANYATKELYESDARIYATALSAEDIKELYQVSAKIDKDGNFHAFEGIEDQSAIKINKQGQVKVLEINENNKMSFDKTGDLNTYEYIEF